MGARLADLDVLDLEGLSDFAKHCGLHGVISHTLV
jgi:hypothetical protein